MRLAALLGRLPAHRVDLAGLLGHQTRELAAAHFAGGQRPQPFVDHEVDEADHHLVLGLVAEADRERRVGVRRVVGRVVEVRDDFDHGAFGHLDRVGQLVPGLPVEVPATDLEQRLFPAVGPVRHVLEVPSAIVHVRREGQDLAVLPEAVARPQLVVLGAGRDLEVLVDDPEVGELLGDRTVREVQTDARDVALRRVGRVVVHVGDDVRALLEEAAGAGRERHRLGTRGPRAEPAVDRVDVEALHRDGDDVVHDLGVARQDLDRGDPLVLGQPYLADQLGELVRPPGWQLDRIQSGDEVGFAELPLAIREDRWGGRLGQVAGGCTGLGPGDESVDFRLVERTLVREAAGPAGGVPGRHGAVGDPASDRLRPGPHLVVGPERHRADLTGPMAAHAVLVQHRGHLAREGGGIGGSCRGSGGERRPGGGGREAQGQQDHRAQKSSLGGE